MKPARPGTARVDVNHAVALRLSRLVGMAADRFGIHTIMALNGSMMIILTAGLLSFPLLHKHSSNKSGTEIHEHVVPAPEIKFS